MKELKAVFAYRRKPAFFCHPTLVQNVSMYAQIYIGYSAIGFWLYGLKSKKGVGWSEVYTLKTVVTSRAPAVLKAPFKLAGTQNMTNQRTL